MNTSASATRVGTFGATIFGMTATLVCDRTHNRRFPDDSFGWPMVFYGNLIPGALIFLAIFYAIDPEPFDFSLFHNGDWCGSGTMAIGLGSLIAMIEERQRKNWFGSPFIRWCGALAAVFIPIFVLIEWYRVHPFVNLRLLRYRNL